VARAETAKNPGLDALPAHEALLTWDEKNLVYQLLRARPRELELPSENVDEAGPGHASPDAFYDASAQALQLRHRLRVAGPNAVPRGRSFLIENGLSRIVSDAFADSCFPANPSETRASTHVDPPSLLLS